MSKVDRAILNRVARVELIENMKLKLSLKENNLQECDSGSLNLLKAFG